MSKSFKIPTVLLSCTADGTPAFSSYLPGVPPGMRLEEVCEILAATAAVKEVGPSEAEQDFEPVSFRWTWYGSGGWIEDIDTGVPPSAARHLLIGVQEELVNEFEHEVLYTLIETAAEDYGFKGYRKGQPGRRVFVIHGRDQDSLMELTAFLERLGYTPLTLWRSPARGGETVVEALERMLPQAELLVALFTPDDEGKLRGANEELQPRARQNVLIEAGFAVIQRRSESIIIALGGTEIPSDFEGIRRIEGDEWSFDVERQLREALELLEYQPDHRA